MKELRFYETTAGKQPFKEWLSGLKDVMGVARINKRLENLMLGHRGDAEPVGDGVFELRIHCGPGYRIYCAEQGLKVVILLYGGAKGSQQRDIKRAISYWKDYQERYNE